MDEHKLIKESREGIGDAWTELVRCFMKDAYYYSLRLADGDQNEAEELSQDAFVQVYTHLNGFREEVPFKIWLFKIITNLFLNRKKKMARIINLAELPEEARPVQGIRTGPALNTAPAGLSRQAECDELQDAVRQKLELLPERQKAVLCLHTYEGLSLEEISRMLDISYEAAKMNLSLARKRMREELKEHLK